MGTLWYFDMTHVYSHLSVQSYRSTRLNDYHGVYTTVVICVGCLPYVYVSVCVCVHSNNAGSGFLCSSVLRLFPPSSVILSSLWYTFFSDFYAVG